MPGRIVVGVDGSAAAHDALRWAVDEAELRNARLVAIHAWSFVPLAPMDDQGMLAMPAGDLPGQLEAERGAAAAELDDAVAAVLAVSPSIEIEKRLVEGDAGEVLVSESADAELVVVGSHGRSGVRAALLGSVSRHVTAHAPCPVVVVRASDG
jgi:nucleotide-binding universal stress UspA family protein